MSQENVVVVRRMIQAFAEGGLEAMAEFWDPDVDWRAASGYRFRPKAAGKNAPADILSNRSGRYRDRRQMLWRARRCPPPDHENVRGPAECGPSSLLH